MLESSWIKNHIQGYTLSSLKLGLFYNNELVSVMLLNKLRNSMNKNNIDNSWDLIRFASSINMLVIGGFGKLLAYFKKYLQP